MAKVLVTVSRPEDQGLGLETYKKVLTTTLPHRSRDSIGLSYSCHNFFWPVQVHDVVDPYFCECTASNVRL